MRGSEKNLYLVKTYDARGNGNGEVCCTITGAHQSTISDYTAILLEQKTMNKAVFDGSRRHSYEPFGEVCETIQAAYGTGGGNTPVVLESDEPILLESNQNHATVRTDGISTTLSASMGMGGGYVPMITNETNQEIEETGEEMETVVRRLTPLECERLQGYPDLWTDIGDWVDSKGKTHKGDADSPRYKALGNSIALPFWQWMADRMVKVLKDDGIENPTMASLFDGIGGFPLVYQNAGCKAIWASEIEEFPMAVTKIRFPEENEDND